MIRRIVFGLESIELVSLLTVETITLARVKHRREVYRHFP